MNKTTTIASLVIVVSLLISIFIYVYNGELPKFKQEKQSSQSNSETGEIPYHESEEAITKYVEKYWEQKNLIYNRDVDGHKNVLREIISSMFSRGIVSEEYHKSVLENIDSISKEDTLSLFEYEILYYKKPDRSPGLDSNKFFKNDETLNIVRRENEITVWVDYVDGFRHSEAVPFIIDPTDNEIFYFPM